MTSPENKKNQSVSVIIPCLNEVKTIAACVAEALNGLKAADLRGEVVVADNGSTDGSQDASVKAGARVVKVPRRGYGAALHAGILSSTGDIVVFGDADMSYPLIDVGDLVRPILAGKASLVLGSRLAGHIEERAMPVLNRYLGTPVLSFLIRRLFKMPISDCNSGMRAIRKVDYLRLNLHCSGMEYASEMIVRAAQIKLPYAEVPINFRKDMRLRSPHLSRWRDGWRHLKFILGNAPSTPLVLAPAMVGLTALATAVLISFQGLWCPDCDVHYHSAFILIILAVPLILMTTTFLLIRVLTADFHEEDLLVKRLVKFSENAAMFYTANVIFLCAFIQVVAVSIDWWTHSFGPLNRLPEMIRLMVFAVLGTTVYCLDIGLGLLPLIPKRDTPVD